MRVRARHTFVVLSCICACAFPGTSSHANESSSTHEDKLAVELEIQEIVVTDTRLPSVEQEIYAVPSKVTIITAEDIKRSGAKTVQEALQDVTGIVWYDDVGNAYQQTIDLRGFNGQPVPNTSVFVDGVRVNEPDFNTVNFDLIPLQTIERIEVLPGPSAIYGKDALGGVINIITKRGAEESQVTGESAWGSFGRQRYNVNASGPLGKLDYYGNFTREWEDGFRDASAASIWRFFGKVGARPTTTTDLDLSYTYVYDDLEQAGSLPISIAEVNPEANFTPGDKDQKLNHFVRSTARQTLPFDLLLTGNAYYRYVDQTLTNFGQTSFSQNKKDTRSWGGALQLTHEATPFEFRNTLVLGGEVTWNDFDNNLFFDFFGFGSGTTRTSTDETIAAAYIQDTLYLTPQVLLAGGLRADRDKIDFEDRSTPSNSGDKVFNRVTPRASVTYLITPTTSTSFSYSQGFRVPTNDELFALGPFGSNPNLQAARSNNFELGLKTRVGPWGKLVVAVYQSEVRDEIFFTCNLCDFSPGDGENRNLPKTRRRGFEVTATFTPTPYLETTIDYSFTEAQFRTDFNLGSGLNAERVESGDSLPLVPKNRLSATVAIKPMEGLRLSLTGLYVSTQFLQNDESNTRNRLPGYFVLNGRVAYTRRVPGGILSGFLNLNNMTDAEYFTSGIYAANVLTGGGLIEAFVVPAPSIAVFGGLSYQFESL